MKQYLSKILFLMSAMATGSAFSASADALNVTHQLPLRLATVGMDAAIDACRAKGLAVSVAVVNREGRIQAMLRDDGAGQQTVQSATDKAITSAVFGIDSGVWVERSKKGEEISPLLNQLPNLLLATGGLVLKFENENIGGIAVAGAPGGKLDEECAKAGRDAILKALAK